MIEYLDLKKVLELHQTAIAQSGGTPGLRDRGLLESAVAQPQMTFGGNDLFPTIADKAAALGFSLIANHPFIDGNKRVGHAALETFLVLNGWQLCASVDEQEQIILSVAAGSLTREQFAEWVNSHLQPMAS